MAKYDQTVANYAIEMSFGHLIQLKVNDMLSRTLIERFLFNCLYALNLNKKKALLVPQEFLKSKNCCYWAIEGNGKHEAWSTTGKLILG